MDENNDERFFLERQKNLSPGRSGRDRLNDIHIGLDIWRPLD
jgi:hypothetical protein